MHVEFTHDLVEVALPDIDCEGGAHLAREIEAIRINIGDHDFSRASHLRNRHGHATDRAGAGDQDIFADELEGKGGVNGVAERVRTRNYVQGNARIATPKIRGWDRNIFSESSRPVHADPFRVWTKMPPSGQAIAAMSANDVSFGRDQLAFLEVANGGADFIDHADELVPDRHRHGNRLLGPCVPVVDVNVRPADGSFLDADQDVIGTYLRHCNFLKVEAWLALALHQRLHRFAHGEQISAA